MKIKHVEFVKSAGRFSDLPPELLPEIALVGRSNVGKSSLLNSLFKQKGVAKVSNTPGKTRLINFFKVTVARPQTQGFYCVDLPGYGYAKVPEASRSRWAPLIESYLTGRKYLWGVIVLLDIRHDPSPLDQKLKDWIKPLGIPVIWVATKADLLPRSKRPEALKRIREALGLLPADAVLTVSAKTGEGQGEILALIQQVLGL